MIQPFIKSKEDSLILATRILDHVAKPVKWIDTNLEVCISIGIAIYPDDSEDAQILINHADSAMYNIKQKGGNSFNFYSV